MTVSKDIKTESSYCLIAKPISWADADTDATILEVKQHNKVYMTLCGEP